jgi:hypothetical protein
MDMDIFEDDDDQAELDADFERDLEQADDDEPGPSDEDLRPAEATKARDKDPDPEPDEARAPDYAAAQAADQARQQEAQRQAQAWDAELARRQQAMESVQNEWRRAEQDFEVDKIDLDKRLEVQQKLIDARYALNEAETARARSQEAAAAAVSDRPVAQRAWVEANPRFASDTVFQAQAIAEAERLAAEGYDNRHPRFYAELDRRLKRSPRMNGNGKGRSSGAPVTRSGHGAAGGEQTLTSFDKKMMVRFGMNPNDKRHAATWIGNKKALAQREQTRKGG